MVTQNACRGVDTVPRKKKIDFLPSWQKIQLKYVFLFQVDV